MRVLLVEDEVVVRDAIASVLEKHGMRVTAVENGLSAFAHIQHADFDAIICDYQLPFLAGGTFFDQIQREFPSLASRVVFVTGWADDPEVREILSGTGQPVLAKPCSFEHLVTTVREVVGSPGTEFRPPVGH